MRFPRRRSILLGPAFLCACAAGDGDGGGRPDDDAAAGADVAPEASTAEGGGSEAIAPRGTLLVAAERAAAAPPPAFDLEPLRRVARHPDTSGDDVRAIVAGGDASIPLLLAGLRADGAAAGGAIRLLQLLPRRAAPELLLLLDDPEPTVRERALRGLELLVEWWAADEDAPRTVERLLAGAETVPEGEAIRRVRLVRLARCRDARVAAALAPFLDAAEGELLAEAAGAAGACGSPARPLAPALLRRLDGIVATDRLPVTDGPEPNPVTALGVALARIGPPDAAFVAEFAGRLDDPASRGRALLILDAWDEEAAPALPRILAMADDGDRWSRRRATAALLGIPGAEREAVRRLLGVRTDEERWATGGARTRLRDLGPRAESVLPLLEAAAGSADVDECVAALDLLGWLPVETSPAVRRILRPLLGSESARTRAAAVGAWLRTEGSEPEDREVLVAGLRDASASVRREALTAAADVRWERDGTLAAAVAPLLGDADDELRALASQAILAIGIAPPEIVGAVRDNLRSPVRPVRLGALRVARLLGPGAASLVPELLDLSQDYDVGPEAIEALAATDVLDDRVREGLSVAAADQRKLLFAAYAAFGARASFLEERARACALEVSARNGLLDVARGSRESDDFVPWLLRHRERFTARDVAEAIRECGPAGIPWLLEEAARWDRPPLELDAAIASCGAAAVPPLDRAVRQGPPEQAALALRFLVDRFPAAADPLVPVALTSGDPRVRAQALRGLAASVRRGAAGPTALVTAREGVSEGPAVRAAAFEVVAALGTSAADLGPAAREALRDPDADVRIAAAGAVWAVEGDAAAAVSVLRAELNALTPAWGWPRIGLGRGRPETDYGATERRWVSAARVLAGMGPEGAPAAEDICWAAQRHGDPGLQARLVEAVGPMGPAAGRAARQIVRMVTDEDFVRTARMGDDSRRLVRAALDVLPAIGAEVPPEVRGLAAPPIGRSAFLPR